MPPKTSDRLHRFQQLLQTIRYSNKQQTFIDGLKPLAAADWDKSLTLTKRPRGFIQERDDLKRHIKIELQSLQFPHCIYCGLHEDLVGMLQRDHIAPKDKYPAFLFEPANLALACAGCNGFLKKNNFDTVAVSNVDYKKCRFLIVHPYRDDYRRHYNIRFEHREVIIKPIRNSTKGRETIRLFDLNGPRQTQLRAANLMQMHITIDPAFQLLMEAAIKKYYYS